MRYKIISQHMENFEYITIKEEYDREKLRRKLGEKISTMVAKELNTNVYDIDVDMTIGYSTYTAFLETDNGEEFVVVKLEKVNETEYIEGRFL